MLRLIIGFAAFCSCLVLGARAYAGEPPAEDAGAVKACTGLIAKNANLIAWKRMRPVDLQRPQRLYS